MTQISPLQTLIEMSHFLAHPERNLVIIGEGNTSCRVDNETFYVKATGKAMHGIDADGFAWVRFAPSLDLLESGVEDKKAMEEAILAAKVESESPVRPSIEVMFHAALLSDSVDAGIRYIAHTHPVVVNSILCSTRAAQFAANRLFPDDVVLCGPRSVLIPYIDPGLPLARAIRAQVRIYRDEWGETPKVILMANHGLITLGRTAQEAINITLMATKSAAVFMGACSVGEPAFLSDADIAHIHKRPDEIYRRNLFS